MREYIIKTVEKEAELKETFPYELASQVAPQKIENAIHSYAPGVSRDQVVAIQDYTVFGSAKKGTLITEEGLYNHFLKKTGCIPFAGFQEMVLLADGKAEIYYEDGNMIRVDLSFNSRRKDVLRIFVLIIAVQYATLAERAKNQFVQQGETLVDISAKEQLAVNQLLSSDRYDAETAAKLRTAIDGIYQIKDLVHTPSPKRLELLLQSYKELFDTDTILKILADRIVLFHILGQLEGEREKNYNRGQELLSLITEIGKE